MRNSLEPDERLVPDENVIIFPARRGPGQGVVSARLPAGTEIAGRLPHAAGAEARPLSFLGHYDGGFWTVTSSVLGADVEVRDANLGVCLQYLARAAREGVLV